MTVDLTDAERKLLVNMLTLEIEGSKFPLSPRIESLKRGNWGRVWTARCMQGFSAAVENYGTQ